MIRSYSGGPGGRISSKSVVLFKVLAAVAVFLGGSSVALASLSHRQARSDSAGWGEWSPPAVSASAGTNQVEEVGLADDALNLLAFLTGAQDQQIEAEGSAGGTRAQASARSTSSSKKVSASSEKKSDPDQTNGSGANAPAPDPGDPDPEPSPSPSPSPQEPSPSPSPTDDPGLDLSAGPVFEAIDEAQGEGEGLFETIKHFVLDLLGFDEVPEPSSLVPTVDPDDLPDPNGLVPTVDPDDLPDPTGLVPTVDPSQVPDPAGFVPEPDGILQDIADLIATIKGLILDLLGIDADDPQGSIDKKAGEASSTAEDISGSASATATATADAVTQTVTPHVGTASGAVDTVTATAIGAAGEAVFQAGEAVATATAAAGTAQEQLKNLPALMVATVPVNTRDSSSTNVPLIAGHEYTFKAIGKFYYGTYGYWMADAECASVDLTNTFLEEPFATQPGMLDLTVNGQTVEWKAVEGGVCSPSHTYELTFTATSGEVQFKVNDDNFTDNSDDLTNLFRVEIWDRTPGASHSGLGSHPLSIAFAIMLLLGSIGEAATRRGKDILQLDQQS